MGAVVCRQGDLLDRPAFAAGQLVARHAGKELQHLIRRLVVTHVIDSGAQPRRIGVLRVFQRVRQIDDFHGRSPLGVAPDGTVRRTGRGSNRASQRAIL